MMRNLAHMQFTIRIEYKNFSIHLTQEAMPYATECDLSDHLIC